MMTITTNSFSSNLINHKEVVDAAKLISLKGDPSASNNLLISIPDGQKYKDTINYLKALNHFILGNYTQFENVLNVTSSQGVKSRKQLCPLLYYNDLLNKNPTSGKTTECLSLFPRFNNQLFPKVINGLLNSDNDYIQENIAQSSLEMESLKEIISVLKSSVITGNHEFFLDYISFIPEKFFRYRSVRELLGVIFFRLRDFGKTKKILKNIKTINAINIKANMALEEKNLDIALGFYLEALKIDPLSINTFRRLLPLTWKLRKYDLALKIIKTYQLLINQESVLKSAIELKNKNYENSYRLLIKETNINNSKASTIELLTGLALTHYLNRNKELKKYSQKLCLKGNSIGCEFLLNNEALGKIKNIQKAYLESNMTETVDLESLTSTPSDKNFYNDKKFIQQRDIESIDDQVSFKNSFQTF